MFGRSALYSYKTQKHQRHKLRKAVLIFLIIFVVYNVFISFFFSVWSVDNENMQPGIEMGDRIIFTSFSLPARITGKTTEEVLFFKRGNIVLVDMGQNKQQKIPLKIIDSLTRFFTFQQVSIFSGIGQYYVKRVIALPGDEISMSGFVFRIKPSGSLHSLTEFELADKPYKPVIPQIPALWNESIPFSGNMDSIVMGPNECFVVSDDRAGTNDSRTWGPVPCYMITAKAVFRF